MLTTGKDSPPAVCYEEIEDLWEPVVSYITEAKTGLEKMKKDIVETTMEMSKKCFGLFMVYFAASERKLDLIESAADKTAAAIDALGDALKEKIRKAAARGKRKLALQEKLDALYDTSPSREA